MADTTRPTAERTLADMVLHLLERDHGYDPDVPGSKMEAAKALGDKLGLQPNSVVHLSLGGYCGRATAARIRKLAAGQPERKPRQVAPWLRVTFANEADRDYVNQHLTKQDQQAILLIAAGQEDFL